MQHFLPFIALAAFSSARTVIDLSGDGWTVNNTGLNITIPGRLPSDVHLDLYRAGVIPDPYFGTNEYTLQWVYQNNWTYTSDPIYGLRGSHEHEDITTYLSFEGLDTFSNINLCEEAVSSTNNEFRQWNFDVTEIIRRCPEPNPRLQLTFLSADQEVHRIANEPGQEAFPSSVSFNYAIPNSRWARKTYSDFGRNYGPAFLPAGPWKPAYVIQLTDMEIHVRNTGFELYRQEQLNNLPPIQSKPWVLNASIDVLGTVPADSVMKYGVFDRDFNKSVSEGWLKHVNITGQGHTITGDTLLDCNAYELWWPNGMGAQKLYDVTVDIQDPSGRLLASVTRRMGFRTIVINQTPISSSQLARGIANGTNFHFEVNGHEFYAKGSNFVPPDAFWPRVSPEHVSMIFESAAEAHQNLIRLSGSGIYNPDYLYDLADELGLLLWSEFTFGDDLYPTHHEFVANIGAEATYQVRRVSHHASLAAWVGNNEIQTFSLWGTLLPLTRAKTFTEALKVVHQMMHFKSQYETLFLKTLAPIVFGNTRGISYLTSSTNSGYTSINHSATPPILPRYESSPDIPGTAVQFLAALGFNQSMAQMISDFPACTSDSVFDYQDTDWYDYTLPDNFNLSAYPRGRFAVEFGWYSWPSIQTWSQVLEPEALAFNDTTLLTRVHQSGVRGARSAIHSLTNVSSALMASGALTVAVEKSYPLPNMSNPLANFSAWCQTTQIFQADFMKTEISFYRWGSSQSWRQMGTLYWQLDDIWQTASWASIEYDGRWKYLHYTIKDMYQPIVISPFYDGTTGQLNITVLSDLWHAASGNATLTWFTWAGMPIGQSKIIPFTVDAINATRVYEENMKHNPMNLTDAVLYLNMTAKGSLYGGNESKIFSHENFFFPVPLREAALVDPELELTYDAETDRFSVEAHGGIAPWTWLDYREGPVVTFDQNAFTLLPGIKKDISYVVRRKQGGMNWVDSVTVRSIWNNTLP